MEFEQIRSKIDNPQLHNALAMDLGETVQRIDAKLKFTEGSKNDVWLMVTKGKRREKFYVLKAHRRLVDDRGFSKFRNEVASLGYLAERTNVSPRLIFSNEEDLLLLLQYIPGLNLNQLLAQGTFEPASLSSVVRSLTEIHSLPQETPHPHLFAREPATFTHAIELLETYLPGKVPYVPLLKSHQDTIIKTLSALEKRFILGDGNPSNLISYNGKVYVIDPEMASIGPPALDIASFLAYLPFSTQQRTDFIRAYTELRGLNFETFTEEVDFNTLFYGLLIAGIYAEEHPRDGRPLTHVEVRNEKRLKRFLINCTHLVSDNELCAGMRAYSRTMEEIALNKLM